MAKKVTTPQPLELRTVGFAVLTILLAGMPLAELIPITKSPGGSIQNWRLEIYVATMIVIFGFWIVKNRVQAAAKLAPLDKHARIMLALIVGFTVWSGLSTFWAHSWASAIIHTLAWITFIAVFVYSIIIFRTKNGLWAVYSAFFIAATIAAILSLIDFYRVTDPVRDMGQIRVRFARIAEFFVTVSPLLCIGAIYLRRRGVMIAALIGWLLSWLVVMLSTSKGAFLAGIIGHLVLFIGCIFFTSYPIRRKMAAIAGLWLVFTVVTQITHAALSPLPTTTEFISGEADPTRETSRMRIFTWQIGAQMAAGHPLLGVGANNFGINFNPARKEFFKTQTEPSEELAEHYMPERAHNEFVQIVAELGVVGGLLFAGVFVVFAILAFRIFRSSRNSFSPVLWAAIAAMAGFLASSFVSSFSFRIIQIGVVFFVAFALAINELVKMNKKIPAHEAKWPAMLMTGSIAGAVIAMILFGMRGYADIQVREGDRRTLSKAMPYYASAAFYDPENIFLHSALSGRYAREGQYFAAAASLRKMIELGGGTTLNYAVLAEYLANEGQNKAANETFDEAVAIYPNSVFLRMRYGVFLEEQNQKAKADVNIERAKLLDAKQANGWYSLLKGQAGTLAGEADIDLADELIPKNAQNYYKTKRELMMATPVTPAIPTTPATPVQ